jgi:integrase
MAMRSDGKITKRDVDALAPGHRDTFLWEAGDGAIKGFGVKCTPQGKKTFIFQYRLGGRGSPTKRIQIAEQGMLVAEARAEAERLRQGVRQGIPPSTTRTRNKAKLVSGLIDLYIADRREQGLRTVNEIERLLKKDVLPEWGARPIASITVDDVIDLVEGIKRAGSPIHANRVLAWVKGMFTFAVKKRMLMASPAYPVEPPSPENDRDRVLSGAELVAIWNAAGGMHEAFGSALRLMMVTGQRRTEVGHLRRDEVNLTTRLWELPADRAKNKQAHTIHLSDQALEVLNGAPELSKIYYFSTDGEKPINGWSRWKDQLDMLLAKPLEAEAVSRPDKSLQISHLGQRESKGKDVRIIAKGHEPFSKADVSRIIGIRHGKRWGYARVMSVISSHEVTARIIAKFDSAEPSAVWLKGGEPWILHDFRRTMTTRLNGMGFAENVVDLILNHRNKNTKTRSTVKKIYNRFLYMPERKAAIEAWGRYVEAVVTGQATPSNVVLMSSLKASGSDGMFK